MNQAVIYSPAKTSMQSGLSKTGYWLLEFKSEHAKQNDPVMGWVGGADTQSQISLKFPTQEAAEKYAQDNNLSYVIKFPKEKKIKLKSYTDNYAFSRREPWSH